MASFSPGARLSGGFRPSVVGGVFAVKRRCVGFQGSLLAGAGVRTSVRAPGGREGTRCFPATRRWPDIGSVLGYPSATWLCSWGLLLAVNWTGCLSASCVR